MRPSVIVVVGAGISGLAAARAAADVAKREGAALEVVVCEREPVVGGKATTVASGGSWLVEEGPTGFLDAEPALDRLVDAAGLTKLPADKAAAHRFIVRGGVMREVHANPLRFAGSGLLSLAGMIRIGFEPVIAKKSDARDESIWEFGARRLGRQAADRLIAPMVLGVFAGDAKRLSLAASFPKMAAMESEHGSLVRAMVAKQRAARAGGAAAGGPAGPAGWLTSFAPGLQTLPRALAATEGLSVRTGVRVSGLEARPDGRWGVLCAGAAPLEADAVVLAGEPWAAAEIVAAHDPALARLLDEILCPPVAVVALGYRRADAQGVPHGFGVLIPRGEGYRILGCLWDSAIFPGRAPGEHVLVRAMLGGAVDPEAGDLSEGQLVDTTRRDLARLLRLDAAPAFAHVRIWPRAIPQYEIGHLERVAAIEERLAQHPGLSIAGNALTGIAFGKAAARGVAMGESAARHALSRAGSTP